MTRPPPAMCGGSPRTARARLASMPARQ